MSKKFKLIVDMLPNLDVLREVANCKQKTGQKNKQKNRTAEEKNVSTDSVCRCNATDKLNITLSVRATEPGKLSFVTLNIKVDLRL